MHRKENLKPVIRAPTSVTQKKSKISIASRRKKTIVRVKPKKLERKKQKKLLQQRAGPLKIAIKWTDLYQD